MCKICTTPRFVKYRERGVLRLSCSLRGSPWRVAHLSFSFSPWWSDFGVGVGVSGKALVTATPLQMESHTPTPGPSVSSDSRRTLWVVGPRAQWSRTSGRRLPLGRRLVFTVCLGIQSTVSTITLVSLGFRCLCWWVLYLGFTRYSSLITSYGFTVFGFCKK